MRVTQMASAAAVVVFGVSVGACSKSASTAPTGTPTQAQVAQMFSELSAVSASVSTVGFTRTGTGSTGGGVAGVPHLAYDRLAAISATASCPVSGTVAVSGNVNPTTSGVSFGITDTWSACQTAHFLVNGSDSENGAFTVTSGGSPTISGSFTETGALTVSGPVWQGNCAINVTLTLSGPTSGPTVSWTGTMCGANVSGSV